MADRRRVHELKSWPEYFDAVQRGVKRFDVRVDDREYRVGDALALMEFDPTTRVYTGRRLARAVTYVMPLAPLGITGGFVALGLGATLDV